MMAWERERPIKPNSSIVVAAPRNKSTSFELGNTEW